MQAMPNKVGIAPLGALGCGDQGHDGLRILPSAHRLGVHHIAPIGRERVVHGGDAMAQQLALGLKKRRGKIHENGGARRDNALDIVRMNIDQARHHVAAVRIDHAGAGALRLKRALLLNGGDAVGIDHQLVPKEQAVRLDDDTVANYIHALSSSKYR